MRLILFKDGVLLPEPSEAGLRSLRLLPKWHASGLTLRKKMSGGAVLQRPSKIDVVLLLGGTRVDVQSRFEHRIRDIQELGSSWFI